MFVHGIVYALEINGFRHFSQIRLYGGNHLKSPTLCELEFVVLDLETTGLYADEGDEILEIGAVRVKNLSIAEEFQSFVRPTKPIPEASIAVHGIRDQDVVDAPLLTEVLPRFFQFCGNRIWVAQNARFDMSFILRDFQKCGLRMGQNVVVDTIGLSKMLFPYETSHNLDVLMARLGIAKTGDRHRSLDDCRYTALVLVEFLKMLEKQNVKFLADIASSFVKLETLIKMEKPKPRGLFG